MMTNTKEKATYLPPGMEMAVVELEGDITVQSIQGKSIHKEDFIDGGSKEVDIIGYNNYGENDGGIAGDF